MDNSHFAIVATSLGVARDMAKAMLSVRDFNLVAEKVAALNEQLLKAHDALLGHSAAMLQLTQENFESREEIRKLKEAAAERGRYSLFEIVPGSFAYRVDVAPDTGGAGDPVKTEPLHYLCQPCFDIGRKAVLGKEASQWTAWDWVCPVCKREIYTGKITGA